MAVYSYLTREEAEEQARMALASLLGRLTEMSDETLCSLLDEISPGYFDYLIREQEEEENDL